jgi:4-carboxymuconolactone decarboxylase
VREAGSQEEGDAVSDDAYTRGLQIQRTLWGDVIAEDGQVDIPLTRIAPDFLALVTESVFGLVWSRPGLSLRDRELVTVSVLAALGRVGELRGHLRGALNVGLEREQLVEALIHVGAYAGVPAAVSALDAAASVLE